MMFREFCEGLAAWGAPIGMKLGMVCLYIIAFLPEIIFLLYVIAVGLFMLYLALIVLGPVIEDWCVRRFCERRRQDYNDGNPPSIGLDGVEAHEGIPGGNPASGPVPHGRGVAEGAEGLRR